MAASKAEKKGTARQKSVAKKSVAKKVADAAGAARKAVRKVVGQATKPTSKQPAKPATKQVSKPATAKAVPSQKVGVAKTGAKSAAKKAKGLQANERAAARKAKNAARKTQRMEKKAERLAERKGKRAKAKPVKNVVKKVSKKSAATREAPARGSVVTRAAVEGPVTQVATQVAEVAKRLVAVAGDATKRASGAVKKAVGKTSSGRTGRAASAGVVESGQVVAGDVAPAFSILDQDDRELTSESLAGSAYVLYFYPKDNTPGCTREAQGFRDEAAAFAELGVRIVGVSPDSTKSHRGFRDKHRVPFALLADSERTLAKAYGVYGPKKFMGRESMGIVRSTFLVDESGKVRRTWRGVRVDGHVAEVLDAAREVVSDGED